MPPIRVETSAVDGLLSGQNDSGKTNALGLILARASGNILREKSPGRSWFAYLQTRKRALWRPCRETRA
jgi:hypothetical protein